MADAHSQYKETQILTASQGKLLLMLYDGAISAIETAIELVPDKTKYDKVNNALIKAQEIIGELMASLNFDVPSDLPKTLQSLYAYMLKRLMEANFQKKKEPMEEVLKYLKELRESWAIAASKVGGNLNSGGHSGGSNFSISG